MLNMETCFKTSSMKLYRVSSRRRDSTIASVTRKQPMQSTLSERELHFYHEQEQEQMRQNQILIQLQQLVVGRVALLKSLIVSCASFVSRTAETKKDSME